MPALSPDLAALAALGALAAPPIRALIPTPEPALTQWLGQPSAQPLGRTLPGVAWPTNLANLPVPPEVTVGTALTGGTPQAADLASPTPLARALAEIWNEASSAGMVAPFMGLERPVGAQPLVAAGPLPRPLTEQLTTLLGADQRPAGDQDMESAGPSARTDAALATMASNARLDSAGQAKPVAAGTAPSGERIGPDVRPLSGDLVPRPLAGEAMTPAVPRPIAGVSAPVAELIARALSRPEAREPLPLDVRARLAPLLGQNVAGVELIRDPSAGAATAAAAADALAVGNAVLLRPGQDLASPRGLGLLAHELTHVLRERDPSFVPAVVRTDRRARPQSLGAPERPGGSPSPAPMRADPPGRLDEEALAELVEGRVTEALDRAVTPTPPVPTSPRPRPMNSMNSAPTDPTDPRPPDMGWGNLPAPWEPLPFWTDPPSAAQQGPGQSGTAGLGTPGAAAQPGWAAVSAASESALPAGPPPAPSGALVARAASTARSVPAASAPASASSNSGDAPRGPEVGSDRQKTQRAPDLDRLAQQVYRLIKKRLSTEMRRER